MNSGLIVRADKEGKGASVWADADGNFGINEIGNQGFHKPGEEVTLRVFVDRGVLEVYSNGGAVTHKCFAVFAKTIIVFGNHALNFLPTKDAY